MLQHGSFQIPRVIKLLYNEEANPDVFSIQWLAYTVTDCWALLE